MNTGLFFYYLFSAIPAVGADLFRIHLNSFFEIIESHVAKRSEVKLFADALDHVGIFFAIWVEILLDRLWLNVSFKFHDGALCSHKGLEGRRNGREPQRRRTYKGIPSSLSSGCL